MKSFIASSTVCLDTISMYLFSKPINQPSIKKLMGGKGVFRLLFNFLKASSFNLGIVYISYMQYEECEYLSEQWFKYQERALGYAACWYYHETKIEKYIIPYI
jgi:hypothetical protein